LVDCRKRIQDYVALEMGSIWINNDGVREVWMEIHAMVTFARSGREPETRKGGVQFVSCDLAWVATHGFDPLVTLGHTLLARDDDITCDSV
jgi:hypothetical protein